MFIHYPCFYLTSSLSYEPINNIKDGKIAFHIVVCLATKKGGGGKKKTEDFKQLEEEKPK